MGQTDSKIVDLPQIFDLDALDGVRDLLLDALDQGGVTVSAAAVERVSTNALFLLLSAAETARRNDYPFALTTISASLASAIERLGLTAPFAAMTKG